MDTALDEREVARRTFLKRALVVAWTTPVIMTIASEHALAQTPTCGARTGGNPCANNPPCPASKPHCCQTTGTNCGCYSPTDKVGRSFCNPA